MAAAIAKLGHVAASTPDLDDSLEFFRGVIGLELVERVGETAYLRGMRDWQHHTLSLRESDQSGVDRVGWRVESNEALDEFADRLEADGVAVERSGADETPGIGDSVRFEAPTGHPYELYYEVEKPEPPEERRSKLHNRLHSPAAMNRVAPRRIDHAHLQDSDAAAHADWLASTFDFEVNELFRKADESVWGWWMSVTALPHDIGLHRIESGSPQFHHLCYHVDSLQDLWDAADICMEHGIQPDGGPGMHAITAADYFYVKDPASGLRLELFAGPGYLNFEPDWEPIEWREGEIGTAADHQWIGTQYSADGTPYNAHDTR